jgi:hypothetical protein
MRKKGNCIINYALITVLLIPTISTIVYSVTDKACFSMITVPAATKILSRTPPRVRAIIWKNCEIGYIIVFNIKKDFFNQ